jgi:hypothetical protein
MSVFLWSILLDSEANNYHPPGLRSGRKKGNRFLKTFGGHIWDFKHVEILIFVDISKSQL